MKKRLPEQQNSGPQNSNQRNSGQQNFNQRNLSPQNYIQQSVYQQKSSRQNFDQQSAYQRNPSPQNSNQRNLSSQNSIQQNPNPQNYHQQNSNHSNSNQQISEHYNQRGAAYIRVSTEDQIEFSPDSQLKKIREYAQGRKILLAEDYIFLDEGISGRYAKKRPAFMKMIGLAKKKPRPFDVILVWKYSRFARSRQDSILYKSMLRKECGIDVISITEQLSDDPTSILVEALLEAMDEYYSINLAQEVRRGMNEKFSRGGVVSVPPFGYRMEEGHFVIDGEKGAIVSRIFENYLLGMSFRQIATNLNAMGIRTNRGNLFENRTIEYILSNPTYTGKLRRRDDLGGRKKSSSGEWNGKKKSDSGKIDGRKKSRIGEKSDNKEGSIQRNYSHCDRYYSNPNVRIVQGEHEAIISEEIFEAVQQRIAENKRASSEHIQYDEYNRQNLYKQNPYNPYFQCDQYPHAATVETKARYMLQGLVRCSNCGAVLTRTGKGKALQCNRYMKGKCTVSHYIRLETLNQLVLSKVVQDWGDAVVKIEMPDAVKSKTEVKWTDSIKLKTKAKWEDSVGLETEAKWEDSVGSETEAKWEDSVGSETEAKWEDSVGLETEAKWEDSVGSETEAKWEDSEELENETKRTNNRNFNGKSKLEMKKMAGDSISQGWIQHRIDLEYKKFERLREAYMEGIDTLEEYRQSKIVIENRIHALKNEQERQFVLRQDGEKTWRELGIGNADHREEDNENRSENKNYIDKNEYDVCIQKWKKKSKYALSDIIDSLQNVRTHGIQEQKKGKNNKKNQIDNKIDKDNKIVKDNKFDKKDRINKDMANDKQDKDDKIYEDDGEISLHVLLTVILDKIIFDRRAGTVELFYKI